MNLPNADQVIIDERKVRDYLLSPAHPIGRFKAAFLARAGFVPENWAELVSQLRELAVRGVATLGERNEYGQKYLISGTLAGPRGVGLEVTTVWILTTPGDRPRLVTIYPR